MNIKQLATVLLVSGASTLSMPDDAIKYNILNFQAEATRQVSNDEMHAVLFIEKSHKQPAELSAQIIQLMNQALNVAKKYPLVKVETGSQTTYPVYDNDSTKLKEWRGRAEINLESSDFKAASQLVNELQPRFTQLQYQ